MSLSFVSILKENKPIRLVFFCSFVRSFVCSSFNCFRSACVHFCFILLPISCAQRVLNFNKYVHFDSVPFYENCLLFSSLFTFTIFALFFVFIFILCFHCLFSCAVARCGNCCFCCRFCSFFFYTSPFTSYRNNRIKLVLNASCIEITTMKQKHFKINKVKENSSCVYSTHFGIRDWL